MTIALDLGRTSHFTIDKRFSWFCVEVRVSWVYCTFRVLRLSINAKYLNPKSRFWVIERDP